MTVFRSKRLSQVLGHHHRRPESPGGQHRHSNPPVAASLDCSTHPFETISAPSSWPISILPAQEKVFRPPLRPTRPPLDLALAMGLLVPAGFQTLDRHWIPWSTTRQHQADRRRGGRRSSLLEAVPPWKYWARAMRCVANIRPHTTGCPSWTLSQAWLSATGHCSSPVNAAPVPSRMSWASLLTGAFGASDRDTCPSCRSARLPERIPAADSKPDRRRPAGSSRRYSTSAEARNRSSIYLCAAPAQQQFNP